MKPLALLKASDTLEALEEEMALGVCPFLFFVFSPRTTSQPGSADAASTNNLCCSPPPPKFFDLFIIKN